jgi:hypothetical protein
MGIKKASKPPATVAPSDLPPLLPCPFCGGEAYVYSNRPPVITCAGRCPGAYEFTVNEASGLKLADLVAAWNRRAK